jgi:hypothetical protein
VDNEVRKTCVVGYLVFFHNAAQNAFALATRGRPCSRSHIREDDSVFRLDAEAEGISRTRATRPFRVSSDGGGGL